MKDCIIIDAHVHLWEKQEGLVNGRPVTGVGNGKADFGGQIRQMMPPYMEDNRNTAERLIANMDYACVKVTSDGIDYYWEDYQGTSMSTPIVSGTVALWLEADPTLNVLDVKRIIEETSVAPTVSPEDEKWARCGILDSYAGLKRVIELSGVAEVKEQPMLKVDRVGNVITIASLTSEPFSYGIYFVSGTQILTGKGSDSASLDISALCSGVYMLKLQQNRCEPQVIKFVK